MLQCRSGNHRRGRLNMAMDMLKDMIDETVLRIERPILMLCIRS